MADIEQLKILLARAIENQAISTRGWIEAFRSHRDLSSVRNATEALARWYGMYKSYVILFGINEVPANLQDDFDKFYQAREEVNHWQANN